MKQYDILINGVFMETIESESIGRAFKIAEQKYPCILDNDVLEVETHEE